MPPAVPTAVPATLGGLVKLETLAPRTPALAPHAQAPRFVALPAAPASSPLPLVRHPSPRPAVESRFLHEHAEGVAPFIVKLFDLVSDPDSAHLVCLLSAHCHSPPCLTDALRHRSRGATSTTDRRLWCGTRSSSPRPSCPTTSSTPTSAPLCASSTSTASGRSVAVPLPHTVVHTVTLISGFSPTSRAARVETGVRVPAGELPC